MEVKLTKSCSTLKCIQCDNHYNKKQKEEISIQIAKQTLGTLATYPNLCLVCIQKKLKNHRDAYLPDLNQAIIELKNAQQVYKEASATKQYMTNKHRDFDQQQQYIKFFLQQDNEKVKQKNQPTRTYNTKAAKSKNKQADLIATLLASLTPEQRALVAKQAAKME